MGKARVAFCLVRRSDASDFLQGIKDYALKFGPWDLFDLSFASFDTQVTWVERWPADGLIICSPTELYTRDRDFLSHWTRPAVNLSADGDPRLVPQVIPDDIRVRQSILLHVHHLGMRHIALLGDNRLTRHRLWQEQFRLHAEREGLKYSQLLVAGVSSGSIRLPAFNPSQMQTEIVEFLQKLPAGTALIGCDDDLAVYALQICEYLGRSVPGEIAIIGNGNLLHSQTSVPPVTTIAVNETRQGYEAAATLHRMLQGEVRPAQPTLISDVRLLARASTLVYPEDIQRALAHISAHAQDGLTVQKLVGDTQTVSRTTFERRFKHLVGQTPGDVIRKAKIEHGRKLLGSTALTVMKIAARSGFDSVSQFVVAFRKETNCTPSEYRRQSGMTAN